MSGSPEKTYGIDDVDIFLNDKKVIGFADNSSKGFENDPNAPLHTEQEWGLIHSKVIKVTFQGKRNYKIGETIMASFGDVEKNFKIIKSEYNKSVNTTFIKGFTSERHKDDNDEI